MADEDSGGGGDQDEKNNYRPHFNVLSSAAMLRNSIASPDNKSVDASVPQYENQALKQLLDRQKNELHHLQEFQLVDDLVLLGMRAGGGQDALKMLDDEDRNREVCGKSKNLKDELMHKQRS